MVATAGLAAPRAARADPPVESCRDGSASGSCEEVVVLGTRTPESSQRATVRTGVVTRAEAESRGARNVGEALAFETSLQVNPEAYGYLGRPSGMQMQGLDADRVLVLEDGERVSGDVGGVVDLAELPLTDVERIEYVLGPTSSLYGSNALGGVVNVVTAAPERAGLSARGRLELRSRLEALGEASLAYRDGDHWLGLDSSLETRPGVTLGSGPELLVPERRSQLIGLRAGAALSSRVTLRLKARWVHDDSKGLSSETVPGLGAFRIALPETTDRWVLRAQESLRLAKTVSLDLSLGKSWFRGTSGRDRVDSPLDEERARQLDAQSLEGTLTIVDGATRTWVLGLRSETERFTQDLTRTELLRGVLASSTQLEVPPIQLASGAVFGQLAWQLSRWTLLPGLRGEVHGRYGGILAPRFALSFRPSSRLSVRGSLGRGFRAPSAKEYGFVFDHSAIGYRVIGNPNLKPERSWGVNGDVAFRHESRLSLRVGGFANWVSQLIATDLAATQSDPSIADYTYVNVARARTVGGDGSARFSSAGERVSAELGYAHLWTRDDSLGRPLPHRPAHTFTAVLRARPSARSEASLRYRLVSSASVSDGVRAPGFGTLDARLAQRLWRDVELYGGVLNLFDVRKEVGRLGDARPLLGRTLYLGLRGALPGNEESADVAN